MTVAILIACAVTVAAAAAPMRQRDRLALGYYAAHRRLRARSLGFSLFATGTGPAATLVLAGFVAAGRYELVIAELTGIAGMTVAGAVIAPRVRAAGALTLPGLFAGWFGRDTGRALALATLVAEAGWLAAAMLAAIALAGPLGLPMAATGGGIALLAVAYVLWGGQRAVVATDVVQAAWYLLPLAATALFFGLPSGEGSAGASAMSVAYAIGLGLVFALRELVGGAQWMRYLSAADAGAARRGVWLAVALRFLALGLAVAVGMHAPAVLEGQLSTPHAVLVEVAGRAGPLLRAAMAAGSLALLLGAADSVLLAASGYLERDVAAGSAAAELPLGRRAGFSLAAVAALIPATVWYRAWEPFWIEFAEVYYGALAGLACAVVGSRLRAALHRPWLSMGAAVLVGSAAAILRAQGWSVSWLPPIVMASVVAIAAAAVQLRMAPPPPPPEPQRTPRRRGGQPRTRIKRTKRPKG